MNKLPWSQCPLVPSHIKFNFIKSKTMVTELNEVISAIEKLKDEEQRQIAKMLRMK